MQQWSGGITQKTDGGVHASRRSISVVRAAVNENVCEDSHTEDLLFASVAVATSV